MSGSATLDRPLLLASASPRRRDILRRAGWVFETEAPEVDESTAPGEPPEAAAVRLARLKARAAAGARPPSWRGLVLGADTVVATDQDAILGKPRDREEARRMLLLLSGTTHRVITGVALVARPEGIEAAGCQATAVTMRALAEDEAAAYVASGEGLGKAGAYAIQESADRFVTRLEGDYDNVVGFPMRLFEELCRRVEAQLRGEECRGRR